MQESEPRLDDSLGPGQDPKFDDLLTSLGKIAQKHLKPVVDSVMRWRKSQTAYRPTSYANMSLEPPKSQEAAGTSDKLPMFALKRWIPPRH
jgi:hypothetical protein